MSVTKVHLIFKVTSTLYTLVLCMGIQERDMSENVIDARGMRCPMPLLMAKRALMTASPGDCIRVIASDPGSWRDFHAYAKLAEECLVAKQIGEQEFVYSFTK